MGASIEGLDIKTPEEMAHDSLTQNVPDPREGEYRELGDELSGELYRYDQERGAWSANALKLMNAIITTMQNHMREMMQGSGSAVLAMTKDALESGKDVTVSREMKLSLVKFTTVEGVGVRALRVGFPPNAKVREYVEGMDPEVRAMIEEFEGENTPGDLTFYFPLQESAIFESMADFSHSLLSMGLMNDFDGVELAHSPLPGGSTWVMSARQIAALADK